MKETLHFETVINAPVQKVWDTMLQLETYKQWTAAFDPSSSYEGSWEKGSEIRFVSASGDGMLSEIAENIPQKFISIKHRGVIKNGVADTTSDEVAIWGSAFENYTFTEQGDQTTLQVDIEMESSPEAKEMKEMFAGMWPNALAKLKEMCER
jgi:uncharacterized protein YndB with AHSA1/START domain